MHARFLPIPLQLLSLSVLLGACASARTDGAGRFAPGPTVSASIARQPLSNEPGRIEPLAEGEQGYVILCGKLLTVDDQDQVFDPGMVITRNGKIEYAGAPLEAGAQVPEGFELLDYSDAWVSPGMIDLHSHVQTGGWGDINDMVYPINADLTVRSTVRPGNSLVDVACSAGVTTLFGIPGSGTSVGGFGLLYKTKTEATYDEVVLRDPGGMKSAFNYNPQRQGGDLGSSWSGLSWLTEDANDRAVAANEADREDPMLENLKRVHKGELPVLIHCASAEGVTGVVRMWKVRYGTNCVVSHGSWDGHYGGAFAAKHGVPVNHGPRTINFTSARRENKVVGGAAAYMAAGVPNFSLNTDAQVMPQEELFLQGSMSARYGADSYQMLRAVTTHPAKSFLISDRVGSLERGKDADVVISTGDPLDPRSRVELVLIEGEIQYSRERDGQWF